MTYTVDPSCENRFRPRGKRDKEGWEVTMWL